MLRKFKISVDGTQYLVEMEEVGAPTPTPAGPFSITPPPGSSIAWSVKSFIPLPFVIV